jgi:hypothetical protein
MDGSLLPIRTTVIRQFSEVEPELEKNWSTYRGPLQTEWRDVREATRDSYERIRNRVR